MKNKLRVTLVQEKLLWEDVTGNIRNLQKKLKSIKPGSTDLVVLPEMFSTGFSMRPEIFAEKEGGSAMQWMSDTASALKCVVTGSIMMREGKKFFNRLIWMQPDGKYEKYDKHHLFRMGNEGKKFTAGSGIITTELHGFRIRPLICYDLRFPVWSRNRLKNNSTPEYDVLIYVANWPSPRHSAWQQLLNARAIENQCYVVGVNRVGKDGNELDYSGGSKVVDPFGTESFNAEKKSVATTVTIDKKVLDELRKKFPVLMDADKWKLVK